MIALKQLVTAESVAKAEREQILNVENNIVQALNHIPDKKMFLDALTKQKFDTTSVTFWVRCNRYF
jgi:hypothetical protein